MEELIFDPSRGLDKALISSLATGEYLEKGESILVTGSSGTGKSFLLSALGAQACAPGVQHLLQNVHPNAPLLQPWQYIFVACSPVE